MTWIALDTSGRACSVAIGGLGTMPLSRTRFVERGHASVIVPMLRDLTAEAGVDPHAVTGVAVGIGPGSFTGIRTAVSVAKGLCLAAGCRLLGVDGFDATRRGVAIDHGCDVAVTVCLDSGRDEIFVASYDHRGVLIIDPLAALPCLIADWLVERIPTDDDLLLTGAVADRVGGALGDRRSWRIVSPGGDVVDAAWLLPDDPGVVGSDPGTVVPLYLRAASVTAAHGSGGTR